MLWSIESCQNRVSADRVSHDHVEGSGVDPSMLRVFKVLCWQVTRFQLITHIVHPRRQKNNRVVDYSIHSPFWNVLNTVVTIISCSLSLAQIGPFHLIPTLPPPNSEVSLMNPSQIFFTLDPLEITRLKPRTFEDRLKNVPIWPPVRFKIAPKHQVTKFKKKLYPM